MKIRKATAFAMAFHAIFLVSAANAESESCEQKINSKVALCFNSAQATDPQKTESAESGCMADYQSSIRRCSDGASPSAETTGVNKGTNAD